MLPMESRVFQANIYPSGLHENSISSCRVSQNPQPMINSVLRRLANSESIQKKVQLNKATKKPKSSDFSRI